MADQLCTPQDLASLLQQDLDLSTATLLIEMATSRVQRAAGGQRIIDLTDTAVIDVLWPVDDDWEWLELPQFPIRTVATVVLDGTTITDWFLRSQRLYRAVGWVNSVSPPTQAFVTYSHGYTAGSQYLQLARDATLSLAQLGYGNPSAASNEVIDDYHVSYADADLRMQMSDHMRQALAEAYGSQAYVTASR